MSFGFSPPASHQNNSMENYSSKEPAPAAGKAGSSLGQPTVCFFCVGKETDCLCLPSWSLASAHMALPTAAKGLRRKGGISLPSSSTTTNINSSGKSLLFLFPLLIAGEHPALHPVTDPPLPITLAGPHQTIVMRAGRSRGARGGR